MAREATNQEWSVNQSCITTKLIDYHPGNGKCIVFAIIGQDEGRQHTHLKKRGTRFWGVERLF